MILTGKAKEDFLNSKVIGGNIKHFDMMMPLYQNALIIEWFDSVGYIIIIGHNSLIKKFYYCIEKIFYDCGTQSTRQEATIEAIKKANELYNLKNK